MRQPNGRRADSRGKRSHRGDGSCTEGGDVYQRRGQRWQCERRKHAEEMRAAGDAVEHAKIERGVCVAEPA